MSDKNFKVKNGIDVTGDITVNDTSVPGSQFAAVYYDGIITSSDNLNFTAATTFNSAYGGTKTFYAQSASSIVSNGLVSVVYSSGTMWYSTDAGSTWTEVATMEGWPQGSLNLKVVNDKFFAVFQYGGFGYSADGINWTVGYFGANQLMDVVYFNSQYWLVGDIDYAMNQQRHWVTSDPSAFSMFNSSNTQVPLAWSGSSIYTKFMAVSSSNPAIAVMVFDGQLPEGSYFDKIMYTNNGGLTWSETNYSSDPITSLYGPPLSLFYSEQQSAFLFTFINFAGITDPNYILKSIDGSSWSMWDMNYMGQFTGLQEANNTLYYFGYGATGATVYYHGATDMMGNWNTISFPSTYQMALEGGKGFGSISGLIVEQKQIISSKATIGAVSTLGLKLYAVDSTTSAGYKSGYIEAFDPTTFSLSKGNSGQYLTTDGTNTYWASVTSLPTQSNNSGKYLTTDGSSAYWNTVDALPYQGQASGLYLTSNGNTASWSSVSVPSIAGVRVASPVQAKQSYIGTSNIIPIYTSASGYDTAVDSLSFTNMNAGTASVKLYLTNKTVDNQKFVLINGSNSTTTAYSTDGITWSTGTMPTNDYWKASAFGNGTFVAIAENSVNAASSTDGVTWSIRTMPNAVAWKTPAYGNGIFLAVGSGTTIAATSTNGISWARVTLPTNISWEYVAYGNGVFIVTSQVSSTVVVTTDGTSWLSRSLPASANWMRATYGNGVFVSVVQNSTTAASSTDGITWAIRTMPTLSWWTGLAYGNGTFVATSTNISTNAASSTDGITWAIRTMPVATNWVNLQYGNGTFVATGNTATAAATSTDGITWTLRTTSPSGQSWATFSTGALKDSELVYKNASLAANGTAWIDANKYDPVFIPAGYSLIAQASVSPVNVQLSGEKWANV